MDDDSLTGIVGFPLIAVWLMAASIAHDRKDIPCEEAREVAPLGRG